MTVKLTGDWGRLNRTLRDAPKQIAAAGLQLTKSEAVFFAGEIRRGLDNQSPGGKRLKPVSRTTLLARRAAGIAGTKALIGTGALRNGIVAKRVSGGGWFAGIFDQKLASVGRLHEAGAGPYVIKMTPRMRAFLFGVVFRQARRSGAGSRGSGYITIRIPPRPFVLPVLRAQARRRVALKRLLPQYARVFRGTMGRA